ncbi:interferon gamma 1 [Heterodontus francisci]|uniref:interferon gamma 1 n=1 Tax=Heterodontus francisci TaxID=7792 RepID=UPI00355C97AD
MMLLVCFIFGMVSSVLSDSVKCAALHTLDEPLTHLKEHFNINHPEVADGGAILTKILNKYEAQPTELGILLNAILRWYLDLFKNIKEDIKEDNKVIKEKINSIGNGLEQCLESEKYNDLLKDLKEISNIKQEDQLVQRKAILELETVLTRMRETGKRRRRRNMGRRQRT